MDAREAPMKALAYLIYTLGYWAWMFIFQQLVPLAVSMMGINPYPWAVLLSHFLAGTVLGVIFGLRNRRVFTRREKRTLCGLVVASLFLLVTALSLFTEQYDLFGSLEGDAVTLAISAALALLVLWLPLTLSLTLGSRLAAGRARKAAVPDEAPAE